MSFFVLLILVAVIFNLVLTSRIYGKVKVSKRKDVRDFRIPRGHNKEGVPMDISPEQLAAVAASLSANSDFKGYTSEDYDSYNYYDYDFDQRKGDD